MKAASEEDRKWKLEPREVSEWLDWVHAQKQAAGVTGEVDGQQVYMNGAIVTARDGLGVKGCCSIPHGVFRAECARRSTAFLRRVFTCSLVVLRKSLNIANTYESSVPTLKCALQVTTAMSRSPWMGQCVQAGLAYPRGSDLWATLRPLTTCEPSGRGNSDMLGGQELMFVALTSKARRRCT